jgi:ceramide glucosyltransferase
MWLFYFFAALLLLQSLASLRGGARYLAYFQRELGDAPADFAPRASVFVPCRGVDQGLRENLSALLHQAYPAYELVFVVDDAHDPALKFVERAMFAFALEAAQQRAARVSARIVVAGRAQDCGQKVHNLRAAVREADAASEVFVFVDTDARPRPDWLRALVAPLADESVGAATGYRWFLPVRPRLASILRAVWNASIASALGENTHGNFCWGGSTAIRRATFEQLNILDEWRGSLSDDYALTRALQRAGLPIKFVPACLTASHEDCTWRELFEFTTRQLKITRVYAPRLWKIVLVSNAIFCAVCYGGALVVARRAFGGQSFIIPLTLLASIILCGTLKAALRLRAVNLTLAREGAHVHGVARLAHLTLWTLTSAIFLWNAVAAACSRRISWRGITYEMRSATRTRVVSPLPSKESR